MYKHKKGKIILYKRNKKNNEIGINIFFMVNKEINFLEKLNEIEGKILVNEFTQIELLGEYYISAVKNQCLIENYNKFISDKKLLL